MKITKLKRTVPAKRKSAVPTKQEHPVPSCEKGHTGHWNQWIKPKRAALLSQTVGPIYFIVKNCGSNNVMLMAQQGDLMDLAPGAVRATYAHGTINVENRGGKPVLIEFDFLPIHRKW